jgi:hypothetical protein
MFRKTRKLRQVVAASTAAAIRECNELARSKEQAKLEAPQKCGAYFCRFAPNHYQSSSPEAFAALNAGSSARKSASSFSPSAYLSLRSKPLMHRRVLQRLYCPLQEARRANRLAANKKAPAETGASIGEMVS